MKQRARLIFRSLTFVVALAVPNLAQGQGSNVPPEVSIVWPNYTCNFTRVFEANSCLKVKAAARDPDGTIAQVRFFSDEVLIGIVTNAPFEMIWDTTPPADHTLTAVAYDNLGASIESPPIFVYFVSIFAPQVFEIQSPANGGVFAAPGTFTFTAEQMTKCAAGQVEFFAGTNSVGIVTQSGPFTVSTPPYSLMVTNLSEGTYQLSVRAWPFGTASYSPGACQGPVVRVTKLGVAASRHTSDGRFEFDVVTSFPTNQNVIEASSNLLNWTPISTNVPFASTFPFTDPSPATNAPRFYRAVVSSE